MIRRIRALLFFEALTFGAAARVHLFVDGYRHLPASIAESVIGLVLLAGLAFTWVDEWAKRAAIAAQAFALVGTLVGLFTIAIGIGPQTAPDIAYHVAIVVVLAWGLVIARRAPSIVRNA
jgi:hypothetical protein